MLMKIYPNYLEEDRKQKQVQWSGSLDHIGPRDTSLYYFDLFRKLKFQSNKHYQVLVANSSEPAMVPAVVDNFAGLKASFGFVKQRNRNTNKFELRDDLMCCLVEGGDTVLVTVVQVQEALTDQIELSFNVTTAGKMRYTGTPEEFGVSWQ